MYVTNTKLDSKLNILNDMVFMLEAGSSKPFVTKLASILHKLLQPPHTLTMSLRLAAWLPHDIVTS